FSTFSFARASDGGRRGWEAASLDGCCRAETSTEPRWDFAPAPAGKTTRSIVQATPKEMPAAIRSTHPTRPAGVLGGRSLEDGGGVIERLVLEATRRPVVCPEGCVPHPRVSF